MQKEKLFIVQTLKKHCILFCHFLCLNQQKQTLYAKWLPFDAYFSKLMAIQIVYVFSREIEIFRF